MAQGASFRAVYDTFDHKEAEALETYARAALKGSMFTRYASTYKALRETLPLPLPLTSRVFDLAVVRKAILALSRVGKT